jgi:hypothetical protein
LRYLAVFLSLAFLVMIARRQEHVTVEHSGDSVLPFARSPPAPKRKKKAMSSLKLIGCHTFEPGVSRPPFLVQIHASVMVQMDFHSHLSPHQEVRRMRSWAWPNEAR